MWRKENNSSLLTKRFLDRFAPLAIAESRPVSRLKKVRITSDSPCAKQSRTMASVSLVTAAIVTGPGGSLHPVVREQPLSRSVDRPSLSLFQRVDLFCQVVAYF